MKNNHASFVAACRAQGVNLCPELADPELSEFRASRKAGNLLGIGTPLARGVITDTSVFSSATSQALAMLINTSRQPDMEHSPRFGITMGTVDNCVMAEKKFGHWFESIEEGNHSGGRIVVDDNGGAVAVQKAVERNDRFGEPSILLLQDVVMSNTIGGYGVGWQGVRLPAGSIVNATFDQNVSSRLPRPWDKTEVVPASQVVGMRFLRLSAFVLDAASWETYLGTERKFIEDPYVRTEFMYLDRAQEIANALVAVTHN